MPTSKSPLSSEVVQRLLYVIEPGSAPLTIEELPGSFSNSTHLVMAQTKAGTPLPLVVRRYAVFGDYDRGEKARREFKTYQLLQKHNLPAPRPILLDDTGDILGTPGIVTSYMEGKLLMSPP